MRRKSKKENVDWPDDGFIHLGDGGAIYYLQEDVLTAFQDVFFVSHTGQRFGFNKCLVAALSPLGHTLLTDQENISGADDHVHVSTDFTNQELTVLRDFFHYGKLPTQDAKLSCETQTAFTALGVDVNLSNVGKAFSNLSGVVALKQEDVDYEEEEKPDVSEGFDHDDDWTPENGDDLEEKKRPKKRKLSSSPVKKTKKAKKGSSIHKTDEDPVNGLFDFPQHGTRDLSKLYQCERCIRGFKSVVDYRMHFHRHDLGEEDFSRAYICVRCMSFEGGNMAEVKRHERTCEVKRHDDIESKFSYYCATCQPGQRFNASVELHVHHTKEHLSNEKGSFVTCPSCGKQSTNPDFLRSHARGEGPYHDGRCVQCPMKFKTWEEHSDHIASVHNGVFLHGCGYCAINAFDTEEEKVCHKYFCRISKAPGAMKRVEVGSAQCTECEQVIQQASQRKARSHFLDFHSHLAKKCDECGERFFDDRLLKGHISQMHSGKRFKCDACDKDFPTKSLLRCHQAVHQERRFSCEICPMTFHTKSVLKSHIKSVHDEKARELRKSKTRMCHHCGIAYPEDTFQAHMKRKHGGQNISCAECNATFNHESIYLKHVKSVHTFVCCDSCGQNVKKGHYKQHVLVHHTALSEMPFVCTVCQKGFSSKDKFLTHQNIHTGLRPHTCKFCDRTFKDPSNCSKHMRESHSALYKASKKSNRLENKPMILEETPS